MVKGKARGRPSKAALNRQYDNDESTGNSIQLRKRGEKRSTFFEGSSNEDISALPCLEMRIHHHGTTHTAQTNENKVVYKYKEPKGKPTVLDIAKINELACDDESSEDISYEDKDKTVTVKKSLIDEYRNKSAYWGPLRIIAENVKVKEYGIIKDAIQAKLQHVEIQATDNDGNNVNEHELKILMSQTPGIIPACDPPTGEDEEGYTILTLDDGERYKVLKKAMSAFKTLSGVEPPFNTKIQKVFTTTNNKVIPITVLTLYPKVNAVVYQSTQVSDKDKNIASRKASAKKGRGDPKLVNYYRQNYVNWAHRGNVSFSEIKKAGVDFFEEILIANPIVSDDIEVLGTSSAANAADIDDADSPSTPPDNSEHPPNSKEFVDEIWNYLSGLVRSDGFLIEFEFEMDDEKWMEVKRAFNMFQLDGEVLPDIVLKMVSKKKDQCHTLLYYLRCVGRLIKSGPINSKADVNNILKCLAKDKYICVGLNKDTFLYQADQNEMLRHHLKINSRLTMLPFESIHDQSCKAIVRDTDNIENSIFQRGKVTVYGPSILCKPCDTLLDSLKDLQDPSLNPKVPQVISQRFVKQRYGPVQSINISQNIKNLFTQTPYEFVSNSKRKLAYGCHRDEGESLPKLLKSVDSTMDLPDDDRPTIKITEEEFSKMVNVKRHSNSTNLKKACDECGFQTKSMLSLFSHMTNHLGPLIEECKSCPMKVSNKEALANHVRLCHSKRSAKCCECEKIFPTSDQLYEHFNIHRTCKPYHCTQCENRMQTLNAYKKHLKINHKFDSFKELNLRCKVCHSYFYTADHLLIHKLNQNHNDREHLKCRICNFSCSLIPAFLTHLLHHTPEQRETFNLATCPDCRQVFFSTYRMQDHVLKKHKSNKEHVSISAPGVSHEETGTMGYEGGVTCGKCFKVFSTSLNLQKHVETVHPEKAGTSVHQETGQPLVGTSAGVASTFSCNMCGRKFSSDHFLTSHMKLHTANRPVFQCEECGYVYAKRTQVLEHIRNDHAEQVEKHQQMQQQHHQNIIPDTSHTPPNPIYGVHQPPYPGGQIVGLHNQAQAHMVQSAQAVAGWNQLKIPSVDQPQPQEVPYNFQTFNNQQPFF